MNERRSRDGVEGELSLPREGPDLTPDPQKEIDSLRADFEAVGPPLAKIDVQRQLRRQNEALESVQRTLAEIERKFEELLPRAEVALGRMERK